MRCYQCRGPLQPDSKYCLQCGTIVPEPGDYQPPPPGNTRLRNITIAVAVVVVICAVVAAGIYTKTMQSLAATSAQNDDRSDSSSREYYALAATWTSTYSDDFNTIGTLMGSVDFSDLSWARQMNTVLSSIHSTDLAVLSYVAPADAQTTHSQLQGAARHLESMITYLTDGLVNRDVGTLKLADAELQTATGIFNNLGTQLTNAQK